MELSFGAALTPLFAAGINWAWWGFLAQGCLALGLVILIHEFGHFAAAKLCGVKVEKFYIGFDPYGLRLFRFRWGETEYGLGAIPLGGYVYMLGQTDNPGKQAEEAERARAAAAEGKPVDPEAAAVWDPRSYPAQSVPERMLIISAGVILNAVTAFFFATAAYLMGVEFTPTAVHGLQPGGVAWERDLHVGVKIKQINDIPEPRFQPDLTSNVALADLNKGIDLKIEREGATLDKNIKPRKMRPDYPPSLGIAGPRLTTLAKSSTGEKPTVEGSPARAASPGFEAGDEVVQIEDQIIRSYPDVLRAQTLYADKPIKVTVRRKVPTTDSGDGKAAADAPTTEVAVTVAPRPLRTLGLTMQWGPVVGVQDNSPASAIGIVPGDTLKTIDGEPLGDPITAGERFRRKQADAPDKKWKVVVERQVDGKPREVTFDVMPRAFDYSEPPLSFGYLSLPSLGVAYSVPPIVAAVDTDGPAAKAGLKPGDVLLHFATVPSDKPLESGDKPKAQSVELTGNDSNNWPLCAYGVALVRPDTKIELTVKDGDGSRKVTLESVESKTAFLPERGLLFQGDRFERKADSLGQAFGYAYTDTRDSMTQVYRFIHAMWIGQIPMKAVGGIITIAQQAGDSASGGFAQLLLFLMMLSCNLAVLNFLPFPVLDGGHMVLLIYEGIFRRPPPERLVIFLNTIGLVCLLGLMIFALTNDVLRISKG